MVRIENVPRNWTVSDVKAAVRILCRDAQIRVRGCQIEIPRDASRGNHALVRTEDAAQTAELIRRVSGYKDGNLELPLFAYAAAPAGFTDSAVQPQTPRIGEKMFTVSAPRDLERVRASASTHGELLLSAQPAGGATCADFMRRTSRVYRDLERSLGG